MNYGNGDNIEEDEAKIINNKNTKKEGIISFSTINKYYLLPFLCPIFNISSNICINLTIKEEKKNALLFILIVLSFCYILPGFLTFIPSLSKRTKNTINYALIYKKKR